MHAHAIHVPRISCRISHGRLAHAARLDYRTMAASMIALFPKDQQDRAGEINEMIKSEVTKAGGNMAGMEQVREHAPRWPTTERGRLRARARLS